MYFKDIRNITYSFTSSVIEHIFAFKRSKLHSPESTVKEKSGRRRIREFNAGGLAVNWGERIPGLMDCSASAYL